MSRPRIGVAVTALALACSGQAEGTIVVEIGEEADTLTRAPAPTSLVVAAVALDGSVKELARTALPADVIDLGDAAKEEIGAVRLTGLAADGRTVVRGESLFVQWGGLGASNLPVFVQRTGELARLPRGPSATSVSSAAIANGRFVVVANGTTSVLYDLLQLRALGSPPAFPRAARSTLTYGTVVVVVDEAGASSLDVSDGTSAEVTTPQGGSFSEVAGGLTYSAEDGTQWVVGATRAGGAPTAKALRLGPDGNLTFVTLAAPRSGACASWVEGRGLVVWGGSEGAPGGELVLPAGTTGVALPYPPDASVGCGLATLDANRVVVAGGAPGRVREIDLACAGACATRDWAADVPLARAEGFGLAGGATLFAGEDASGSTRVFRVTATEAREIATKLPRRGARLVASPTGGALLVGGAAGIEQYLD